MNAFLYAVQSGNPAVPGSGLSTICYFTTVNPWNVGGQLNDQIWSLAISTAQRAGRGASNTFGTVQGGSPADGLAHDAANQLPGLQAAQDWLDALSPAGPTAAASPRRGRYFGGLFRRLARV